MPGNLEEKEKCLEKLTQMHKYLPFLDYMIDKIKKKNNEISLECQLSKFQLLRSMIAEKNGKCTWDVVVKVEDVIKKLITKLDFKESCEKPKEQLLQTENLTCKTSMATSVSIVPSTTTAVSVATTTSSRSTTVDTKPQDTVNLLMKTIKISIDSKNTKNKELLSSSLGPVQPVEVSERVMETDLDKDLDGFDLIDCPGLPGTGSKNVETVHAAPEKPATQDDLLSSSRERLLKSLQSRFFPGGIPSSSSSPANKSEKPTESQSSAFSRRQTNISERKHKSDVSENCETSAADKNTRKDALVMATEKKGSVVSKSHKTGSFSEKNRTGSASVNSDVSLKQKLKEKLSTDICEVYRVPGKSVGGSLRYLKDSKDPKRNIIVLEEEELFKPDKLQRIRPSIEKKDNLGDKSRRDSTHGEKKEKKNDQSSHKHGSSGSKKSEERSSKKSSEEESIEKHFELCKVNDEELLGLAKENVQSFPHLAKMKLSQLKEAVQSSIVCKLAGIDTDEISEISDDSLPDIDDVVAIESKKPFASKEVTSLETKIKETRDIFADENLEDEDYALKLIEETTPKTYLPKKKKGLLELPMPITDDLFDDISSIESFESFLSPTENKDPRVRKPLEIKKPIESKPEPNVEVCKPKEVLTIPWINPQPPKEPIHSLKPQIEMKKIQEKPQDQVTVESTTASNTKIIPKPLPCINDPRRHSQSSSEAKSYAEYKRRKRTELQMMEKRIAAFSVDSKASELPQAASEETGTFLTKGNNPQDPRRRDSMPKTTDPKIQNPIRTYENKKKNMQEKPKSRDDSKERRNSKELLPKDDKSKKDAEQEELVSPLEELYGNERKPKTGRGYGIQNFKIPKKVAHRSQSKKESKGYPVKKAGGNSPPRKTEQLKGSNEKQKQEVSQILIVESKKVEESKISDFVQVDSTAPCKSDNKEDSSSPKTDPAVSEAVPETSSVVDSSENSTNTKATNSEPESATFQADTSTHMEEDKTDVKQAPKAVNDVEVVPKTESKIEVTVEKVTAEPQGVEEAKKVLKQAQETVKVNEESQIVEKEVKVTAEPQIVKDPMTKITSEPQIVENTTTKVTTESQTVEEMVKKTASEPQIVECDSSVESASLNDQTSDKDSRPPGEKSTALPKEEITQEFVEALIRKSFQSGEGKLLLAQVKLFEKFARKLNSKKLKTIQKIINSESDSSSSPSESSSEDERKRKKSKKSEEKSRSKKRKKKGKSKKKKKSSSSSSSSSMSETEESSEEKEEENCDKKEEENNENKSDNSVTTAESDENKVLPSEESAPKTKESLGGSKTKTKKRRKNLEICRSYGGKRAKRKQKQKKMLEEILNEGSQPEASNYSNKKQRKPKTRVKTELDRLHEDIRSMFICEGVVTVTGQRMCRILKRSGGNMNNLDIEKESAKMVEEEKLRNTRSRNSRAAIIGSAENRSRSQSLDKAKSQPENDRDEKLTGKPCVILQRIDLDNFGYGIKISDDCISFRRLRGKNTALRRTNMPGREKTTKSRYYNYLARNVFLPRNKRKFERLRDSNKKKYYMGKKLSDVVKNLPLKMAKMKHLQICGKKDDKREQGRKNGAEATESGLSEWEITRYAYDRNRDMYPCKLCSCITRNIATHYKTVHPESEVLISRLNKLVAKKAILETKKLVQEEEKDERCSLAESMQQKVKALMGQDSAYICRMCKNSKITDVNAFACHLSTHTGEFRYECPSEGCKICRSSYDDIKLHILMKHPRYRNELNSKITELYQLTVNEGNLFGFLCSKCNFVQLSRNNVENHISIQHKNSQKVDIIKINMSGKKSGRGKKRINKPEVNNLEAYRKLGYQVLQRSPVAAIESDDKETSKRKLNSEDESGTESGVERPQKKTLLSRTPERIEGENQQEDDVQGTSHEGVIDLEESDNIEKEEIDNPEMEDCVDLKTISELKGSDIIKSVENPKKRDSQAEGDKEVVRSNRKLKVGPLEAQVLENGGVLYECFVKGCLFSTRLLDLFQKHIEISHCKTKWNGLCEMCSTGKNNKPKEDSLKLLAALKHLKIHDRERFHKNPTADTSLVMEFKDPNPSENLTVKDNNEQLAVSETPSKGEEKTGNIPADTSYPVKPLLRVRNFLGDRLSTPKPDEIVAAPSEGESNISEPSTNATKMFTIENVRSLTEIPSDDFGLKIEQVCSLKEQPPKPGTQLGPETTIIVRSCPSRAIAIQPNTSGLPVDMGQIIRAPTVSRSVVLSPISGNSPVPILSKTGMPRFPIKPIVISADTVRCNTPTQPITHPGIPSTMIVPVTTGAESTTVTVPLKPPESGPGRRSSLETEKIASPCKSPSGFSPVYVSLGGQSPPLNEDADKQDPTQRMQINVKSSKKCLKDAKVYQDMLTKLKLCHLFKCMGIECSFTCNNEEIFVQHIGLHEAQRRLGKSRTMMSFKMANRSTDAYHWQQCAYCCEVLTHSNHALSQHVLEEHGHCMYQCAFCFYRAISHSYVEIHQNLAHSRILKTTPRLIYKCRALRPPPSQASALEKHGKRQSVRPYHCDQCGKNFYITNEFTSHLATEHQSVTAYTCHICKNLCFKVNRLINHYKLHSYSMYQCAFCLHGTETEKEMVFHLSNFHFSQPAVMYMRALAEGQSDEEKEKLTKKKRFISNQLDSLKVILYECDTLNTDCVVEVEQEDDITENASNLELSDIVAELGISTDSESASASTSGVTPLMQELASIGDKTAKNLTVKTLLPNAQFSTENESGTENCSVLISSGLSIPSDQNDEKEEMSIPLGQLPLEAVSVQHKEAAPPEPPPTEEAPPDKNLKLNEIIVNRYCKTLAEEEKAVPPAVILSTAVHKLPPVVLSRNSTTKNSYPSKCTTVRKKSEEQRQNESGEGDKEQSGSSKEKNTQQEEGNTEKGSRKNSLEGSIGKITEPLITNVVSLSNSEFEQVETSPQPLLISEVCSLSTPSEEANDFSKGVGVSVKSKINNCSVLKPPIIRVEDFPIDENASSKPSLEITPVVEKPNQVVEESEVEKQERPSSPDVIILEQQAKDIVTVTIDSDEEKDESEEIKPVVKNDTIRQEMELLREQIANETDSLLSDEVEERKATKNLSLDIDKVEETVEKSLLSPIEEAICSLNKKLQSETEVAQRKEEDENSGRETPKDSNESSLSDRPRTRFGRRYRKKEVAEVSEADESSCKKEDPAKGKKFKGELSGKDLFICGNEKCNFAAENDSSLKDHLYVCDLSRESSVLVCPHCLRQYKQFHPYLDHLRYHGEKKYHCGICSFSSAVDLSTMKHVKQKHKCSLVKILPKESQTGHLIYYPKNYKVCKADFEENGYSPGDEDKLPRQSVYQINVKCAKCPYFTKVRSNMVRHLKIHVKSVETEGIVVVPSTAPTNPVPCLETKERMFDKMTNLAASSQLAQAKEKSSVESLSPEEEAKLPQFVTEQMRYKCCLPDCNYITVDDGMLRHHIKALHDEINYYSCPHCKETVHADVRHVTLDKVGHHLKHHDSKLYKCAHCIYFHYQKNMVEKHTVEKHPDRRYYVHTVREPKPETPSEEESSSSSNDSGTRLWKCALCDEFKTLCRQTLMDHLLKSHNTKSKYKCQLCTMKGNSLHAFATHFISKHPGEKVQFITVYNTEKVACLDSPSGNSSGADSSNEHFDTTPLWQRGAPRIRHIRGILIEEEEIRTKKSKRMSVDESEAETSTGIQLKENAFYCPLCMNKKKPFFTRNENYFRTHLYQELNYQQFACILCGKMFVDRKDFERHHARIHPDKPQAFKQTKEDHEIKFWVDKVIAKRKQQMEERKRKLSDEETSPNPAKKKKEV